MGAFAYVVPFSLDDNCIIIFIDLVLPMGLVNSSKLFCDFSEKLVDAVNALVDTELPVLAYGTLAKILTTGPSPLPPHMREPHPY